jgi:hypothetical protein
MGYLKIPKKNWRTRPYGYEVVEVQEPAGHTGSFVTLMSGAQIYNNKRPVIDGRQLAASALTNPKESEVYVEAIRVSPT